MSLHELKAYSQWVVANLSNKEPLNPCTGNRASVTDASTWASYDCAAECCAKDSALTLGFVLTPNDPFVCVDLDTYKTNDQSIIQMHRKIYEAFDSYSELSMSGGVHIWMKGNLESGRKWTEKYLEIYPHSRYITVSGNALNTKPIAERQTLVSDLWQSIAKRAHTANGNGTLKALHKESTTADAEVCNQAFRASNGQKFHDLYVGKWEQYYTSPSEADLAFVNIVAFYTDDVAQVVRIFRASQLGKRAKAGRNDYLVHKDYGIVTKAFDRKLATVNLDHLEQLYKTRIKENELPPKLLTALQFDEPTPAEPLQETQPKIDFDLPPGLLGDITYYIYSNAVRPVKEVALAAAMAYMSGICARSYNISKSGLNQYIALLAPTAGGKEGAASGISKLTNQVRATMPLFDQFLGPGEISSPQALVKQLEQTPCFMSQKGELGFWLQKLTSQYARSNELMMRAMLLDLFTKSGSDATLRGTVYSDKAKNIAGIENPAFTLLGDSTPDQFYKALDEDNIEEGLVARFTILESLGERVPYNTKHGSIQASPKLIQDLAGLAKRSLQLAQIQQVYNIQETPEATAAHMEFMEECYDRVHADKESPTAKLYSRAHLRLLRLAGLVAVGCNRDYPVLELDHVLWAKSIIEHGVEAITRRFETGRVGEHNYQLEQRVLMGRFLHRYITKPFRASYEKSYGITREMFDYRVITNRLLQGSMLPQACFRKDRNATMAFKNLVNEMIDNGNLVKVDSSKVRANGKHGLAYYVADVTGWGK